MTETVLGSVSTSYAFNTLGEVNQASASVNGGTIFNTQYFRDNLGRITQKTEIIDGATDVYGYSYDAAGRLISVTQNGVITGSYTYDSNGNRISHVGPSGAVSGSYDNQDRLTAYGATTYTYTANGDLSIKTTNGQTTTYNYDALGNILSATLPDNTVIEYVIDGRNRRIGKKVNGTLVQGFLYQNQLRPVAELDGLGNVVSRFIYATKTNVPEYMIKGGITYRIITDHLGSPRLVVDATTGVIAQRMDYDEFGNVTQDTNPGFQPFGFAGGLYDRQTKLVRFGARDYDAETGRWTAKDPVLFAGGDTNFYAYAHNPVNWIDPWGLKPGDPYPTMDDAGINAISDINPTSISHNLEYGGYVYKNPGGTYSYTSPVSGSPTGLTTLGPKPTTGTVVGDYHTHGAYDPRYDNENFSRTDKKSNIADNTVGYLGTPSGAIKKYDPTTGKVTTLKTGPCK